MHCVACDRPVAKRDDKVIFWCFFLSFFFGVFMILMFFFICWSSNWLVPTWWKIDLSNTTSLFQDHYYFHLSFLLIRFWSFNHWQKRPSRENSTYHFWIITKTWWQRSSQIQIWTLKSIQLPLKLSCQLIFLPYLSFFESKNKNKSVIKSNLTIRNGPFS